MNTKASVAYGWGILVAAGGGAYYFAKRSINADRHERAEAEERRRQAVSKMQYNYPSSSSGNNRKQRDGGEGANPSREAGGRDPSPADGHVQEPLPVGKYETKEPFRSKKGDRFS